MVWHQFPPSELVCPGGFSDSPRLLLPGSVQWEPFPVGVPSHFLWDWGSSPETAQTSAVQKHGEMRNLERHRKWSYGEFFAVYYSTSKRIVINFSCYCSMIELWEILKARATIVLCHYYANQQNDAEKLCVFMSGKNKNSKAHDGYFELQTVEVVPGETHDPGHHDQNIAASKPTIMMPHRSKLSERKSQFGGRKLEGRRMWWMITTNRGGRSMWWDTKWKTRVQKHMHLPSVSLTVTIRLCLGERDSWLEHEWVPNKIK